VCGTKRQARMLNTWKIRRTGVLSLKSLLDLLQ
jgi:hypothetical protein